MKIIKTTLFLFALILGIELYLKILKPSPYEPDLELGWTAKKNFKHVYDQSDFYNNSYKADYITDKYGARFSAKTNNSYAQIKFLVIGDSFTMDPYVGNAEMWFSIMASKTKKRYEVRAFGGGGYGSLQQYLLLKRTKYALRYYKPDIFIMQFCSNDFSNNSLDIELSNFSLSQYMRRPYLINGEIYYHKNFFTPLFTNMPFFNNSRIFAKLVFIYEFTARKYFPSNYEKIDNKTFIEAKRTTFKILKDIRNLYPNTPAFIFSCSNKNSKLNTNWQEMAKKANFTVLNESSNFIDQGRKKNKKFFYKDGGHLNKLGNYNLGELIFEEIKKNYKFN